MVPVTFWADATAPHRPASNTAIANHTLRLLMFSPPELSFANAHPLMTRTKQLHRDYKALLRASRAKALVPASHRASDLGLWRGQAGVLARRSRTRELAFGHPRHSLARQAADDFAAIAAINRANVFDRLTAEQIGRSRKAKNRRFGPNAEQLGFRGGGDAAFRDFIRKVDLDSVAFPERLVEGAGGLESAGKLGAEARGQVGGFNAERNGVGEADALETIDFVPIGEAEGFRHFARRADAREFEHLGARASAACAHFLAEGEHLAGIFFELSVRDERAFSALAIDDAHFAEGLEGLAGRHAADAKAGSDFLFGGQGVTGVQSAGANLLEQLLADLVVERQNALPVERQHFQNDVPPVCQARAECRSAETNGTGGETAEFSHCRNPKTAEKAKGSLYRQLDLYTCGEADVKQSFRGRANANADAGCWRPAARKGCARFQLGRPVNGSVRRRDRAEWLDRARFGARGASGGGRRG